MSTFGVEELLKLGLAILLGGVVGLERELHDKPVGFRSNIVICLGATLFTMASIAVVESFGGARGDPTRIAANIVTGIGFLGAGAIARRGDVVQGVTTASSIWLVAAIGLSVGSGQYPLAVAATLATVLVLLGFRHLEEAIERRVDLRSYTVVFREGTGMSGSDALAQVEAAVRDSGLRRLRHRHLKDSGRHRHDFVLYGPDPAHQVLHDRLADLADVSDLRVT